MSTKITQSLQNGERMTKIVRENPSYAMMWLTTFNRATPYAKEICESLFNSMKVVPDSLEQLNDQSIDTPCGDDNYIETTIYKSKVGGACIEINNLQFNTINYYWLPKLSIQ